MEYEEIKMDKDTELKPCPFCGSKAEVFVTDTDPVYGDTWYFLGCVNRLSNGADHNCIGSCLSQIEERDLKEKIDLWNKRK
jgi:hypothetical protein